MPPIPQVPNVNAKLPGHSPRGLAAVSPMLNYRALKLLIVMPGGPLPFRSAFLIHWFLSQTQLPVSTVWGEGLVCVWHPHA